jgi:hypothetical protein
MPAQHQTKYIKTRNGQEVTTVTSESTVRRASSLESIFDAERRPGLACISFSRKINPMEFRGIRYTIRAGIERGQYRACIHPDDDEMLANTIFFSREDAEFYARRMITKWLAAKSGHKDKTAGC